MKFILTIIFFIGCVRGDGSLVAVHVSDEVKHWHNGELVSRVEKAVHYWDIAGAQFRVDPVERPVDCIEIVASIGECCGVAAWYAAKQVVLSLDAFDGYGIYWQQTTIAHELGHAMRLEHTRDPNSVMFATTTFGWPSISEVDIQEHHRVWGSR